MQFFFTLISLIIGWQFILFVRAAQMPGDAPLPYRPPGVEGYLPISGLMGSLDWIYQGALNTIHPAATVLFLTFVGLSLLIRKSFCSWICPVGFISDNLARIGKLMLGRNYKPPKWLDVFLRSLKYLILGFFLWAIFSMSAADLRAFIESPYNKVSDIKMLLFFAELGTVGATVLAVLAVLSVFIQGFWCRYLCPYGALLGLFSWMSPVMVHRNPDACTDCGLCDNACPARLPVMSKTQIISPECIGCHDCVTTCPVPAALWMGTRRRRLSPKLLAGAILGLFLIIYSIARISGVWENNLNDAEIRHHISLLNSPEYGHPGR